MNLPFLALLLAGTFLPGMLIRFVVLMHRQLQQFVRRSSTEPDIYISVDLLAAGSTI
jgi:hypothetical protein